MQIVLDQFLYFGFFQSLLLLLIYVFSPQKRRHINSYMAVLILALFIGMTGKVLYNTGFLNQNFRLISLSELSALLFGPTIYLFTRATLERKKYSNKDLLHYVPEVVYSLFVVFYFIIPSDITLGNRIKTGELIRVIYLCHAIGLIVNIAYWIKAVTVFLDFQKRAKTELSYSVNTRFIINFLSITGLCLLVWVVFLGISLLDFTALERIVRPYIWMFLSFVILFISYYGMAHPEVLRIAPEALVRKYAQSKLSIKDLEKLKVDLDRLMEEKKPYLNNKLLKAELAEMIGISNPELARLLNENIGMNFFEYVNYFRIKEFINLAKTDKANQLTFFGLAQEAGFNSKTTFNKSFKKLMGSSPSAYFNKEK